MRNDQLPEDNAESERTHNRQDPEYMDYTPLVILQQRLNDLETNYGAQNPNDDSILAPRIARVAPMSAGSGNSLGRLPSINYYQATATFDISALQLPNPTEATFSNAAAAVAAATPVATMRSDVHVAANSASYSTASSNTTTYASSTIRYTAPQPSLYCIASMSRDSYYGSGSTYNSDTDSAASSETISANEHDYDEIPPFRRRALALEINDAAAAIVATALVRRRALDEDEDEDMAEDTVPRKKAKLSMHHVNTVDHADGKGNFGGNGSGVGGNGSGIGGNGSGIGGNGSGIGGNGSDIGGNGNADGENGGDEMMDFEL